MNEEIKIGTLSARKYRRKANTIPFNREKTPPKQNFFLMPFIWLFCAVATRRSKLKIKKTRMKGLKPPFLVFGTHHAWMDFYVTPLALFPYRANYVSELEGFEYFGEWIYRQIGCLGTRKFINDISLVKNIKKVLDRKGILVVYPEARYANVGTNTDIPESVGKMAKKFGVPVVAINMHGNYLQSPIWNTQKRKGVPLETEIIQLFTKEEVKKATVKEINSKLSDYLTYDEYKWQYEKRIKIDFPFRAEGLHKVLYRCCSCNTDFSMNSKNTEIFCKNCGQRFYLDEYGKLLKNRELFEFSHIPDWYEWQRKCVHEEIERGEYFLDAGVHIEALPNAVNFIECGDGRLVHNEKGFSLYFKDYRKDEEQELHFSPAMTLSVHTEYDYREKGQCITLSTNDDTYFIFPLSDGFNVTKIQFATEYLYKMTVGLSEKSRTNRI